MRQLQEKIKEALLSALPVTLIVYLLALTPLVDLTAVELVTFTVGAVLLILGIGLFNLGADLAMTLWVSMWVRALHGRKSWDCCLGFALFWVCSLPLRSLTCRFWPIRWQR